MITNLLPNIYISANKRSGKTTIANFLEKEFGYKRMSFANPLKEVSAILIKQLTRTPLSIDEIIKAFDDGTFPKDEAVTIEDVTFWSGIRPILQGLGDGCREVISDDVWIEALLNKMPENQPVVIDDCRYPNEGRLLKEKGFMGIHISNPGTDGDHPSEMCESHYANGRVAADLVVRYEDGVEKVLEDVRRVIVAGNW